MIGERYDRIFKGTVLWREHKSFIQEEITNLLKEQLEQFDEKVNKCISPTDDGDGINWSEYNEMLEEQRQKLDLIKGDKK